MGCGKVGYEVVTRIISCLSKRKAIDKEPVGGCTK